MAMSSQTRGELATLNYGSTFMHSSQMPPQPVLEAGVVRAGYRSGQQARPVTETELLAMLDANGQDSVTYYTSEISGKQEEALKRYNGERYGDEIEGKSAFVSKDVSEVIDWLMPDLIRMFVSGDKVVWFDPNAEGDEDKAAQATDYCNYIFWNDNDGYTLLHDALQTGLLQKLGVLTVEWEDDWKEVPAFGQGLSLLQLQMLMDAPDTELTGWEPMGQVMPNPLFPDGIVYAASYSERTPAGRCVISAVPPEEFQVARRTASLSERPSYIGHWPRKTRGELLEMGYPYDIVMGLKPENVTVDRDGRENERWAEEDHGTRYNTPSADGMTDELIFKNEFIFADIDGDGMPEYVNVRRVDRTILEMTQVADHPFVGWAPTPQAFRAYGKSVAEDVWDIQRVKTVLVRQQLDNVYQMNNGREAIDITPSGPNDTTGVNMDDVLNVEAGAKIRTFGDPRTKIMPLPTPPLPESAYAMIGYMDEQREARSGVSKSVQSLDADVLNDSTALGINRVMDKMAGRTEFMGRNAAEMLVGPLFKKMLALLCENQDFERVIRLRDEWIPMDPRTWNADMDVSVNVGLGSGNKDQHLMHLRNLAEKQEQVIQTAGMDNPLVTVEQLYNTYADMVTNADLMSPERYWTDPSTPEVQQRMAKQAQQPPPPNPLVEIEQIKAQVQMAQEQNKRGIEEMKAQVDILVANINAGAKVTTQQISSATSVQTQAMKDDAASQPAMTVEGAA